MRNHYQTLGIKNLASVPEIRKAYRSLALKHHPDRGGEIKRMQEINVAYEYLMKNKEIYDNSLRPSKPELRTYGFTIIVNGYGFAYGTAGTNINRGDAVVWK